LFEGGFPFTFCEAFSVGTPSLLSNIPVIQEVTDNLSTELRARTLFDPYDSEDLKTKTIWALDHRAELLSLQQELYDAHPTWDQVAAQYIDAIFGTESQLQPQSPS
jgi:glycosyltransferase involved in cell wall biosynthesis